jgi:hypothetical protein
VNAWKVILATLVIFGAGVITGGLLVTYSDNVQRHQRRQMFAEVQRMAQRPNTNTAARDIRVPLPVNILLRKDFLERLDHELKLDAEQRERIEKIIGEGQEGINEKLAETKGKIRAGLKPGQQDLFTELLKRRPAPARDHAPTNMAAPATPSQPSK